MGRKASITFHIDYKEWDESQFKRREPEGWDRDSIMREAVDAFKRALGKWDGTLQLIDTEYDFEEGAL